MNRVARQLAAFIAVCTLGELSLSAGWAQGTSQPLNSQPSPLLTEPKTPGDQFRAALLLIDLGRLDLAKVYLDKCLEANPSDDEILTWRDVHGTAAFVRVERIPELQPAGQNLLERLIAAHARRVQDPEYLQQIIQRLFESSYQKQLTLFELRRLGRPVVPELLFLLSQEQNPHRRVVLIEAILSLHSSAAPVLMGGLLAPDPATRRAALEVLQQLRLPETLPLLWPLAFSAEATPGELLLARRAIAAILWGDPQRANQLTVEQGLNEIHQKALSLYSRKSSNDWLWSSLGLDAVPTESNTVELWRWDPATSRIRMEQAAKSTAEMEWALRLAWSAWRMAPENSELQRLYLSCLLAADVYHRGWEQPLAEGAPQLWQTVVSLGETFLQEVLRQALMLGRYDTAWNVLQALAAVATREVLQDAPGHPAPVIMALNAPNPRVQLLAVETIWHAQPNQSFRDSSRVIEILRRALGYQPGQRALVIHSDHEDAAQVAGFLKSASYQVDVEYTGKEGFRRASETLGYDLVVIHVNIAQWDLVRTLANFRADARTASLPLVIYGGENLREPLAGLIQRHQPACYAGTAPGASSFWDQVRPFMNRLQPQTISSQQRRVFQRKALKIMLAISEQASSLWDISSTETELIPLIYDAELAEDALRVLRRVPSAQVQMELARAVLQANLPVSTRTLAAECLCEHIARYHLVLEDTTVQQLRSLWSDGSADPQLQFALTAFIGKLRPNSGLIGERLKTVPAHIAPAP